MEMKIRFIILLTLLFAPLHPAWAYVLYTQEALVAAYFPEASRVERVVFTPDEAQREQLRQALGYGLPRSSYEFLVGYVGDQVVGYTLIDDQKGQHEPITFGVLLSPDGKVQRVEIMVYREAYGDGVKAESFRDQFVGADASTTLQLGKNVRIISGATISSRSITVGVRRAVVVWAAWHEASGA